MSGGVEFFYNVTRYIHLPSHRNYISMDDVTTGVPMRLFLVQPYAALETLRKDTP